MIVKAAEVGALQTQKEVADQAVIKLQAAKDRMDELYADQELELKAERDLAAEKYGQYTTLKNDWDDKVKEITRLAEELAREKEGRAKDKLGEAERRVEFLNSAEFQGGQLFNRIVAFTKLGAQATLDQLKELGHLSADVSGKVLDLQKALVEAPPDLLGKFV